MESSFTLLREIGILTLDENQEVHFSIDAYRGFRYVSVRRYLKADGFTGPTRDGITLSPEMVEMLVPLLQKLPDSPQKIPAGEVAKLAKRAGVCVVVRVVHFKENLGLDLRQWQSDTGFTKKGIWLPIEHLAQIKTLFNQTVQALNERPDEDF